MTTTQVKKGSKKSKVSPAENEIAAEFYQPQRVKTNRAAKPAKFFKSQEAKEAFEASPTFDKDSIPYIDKQIFIENSLDRRDTAPTTAETKPDGEEVNEQGIESKGGHEEKSNIIDITTILSDQYIPKKHLFREKESQEILNFIAKCVKNDCYESLLITGPPGTGKTTVINHVIKKLEEQGLSYIGEKRPAEDELEWVDCSGEVSVVNMDTSHSEGLSHLVLEIIKAVDGKLPLSVGAYMNNAKILTEKLKQVILLRKTKKLIVVILDEIDKMLSKATFIKEMVELLKVPRYPSSNLIIIATTNIPDLLNKLSEQHKTTIEISQLAFEPYTLSDMLSILQKRFELAGHPDLQSQFIMNENIFEQVNLDSCIKEMNNLKDTDIRHVLRILRKAYNQKNPVPVQTIMEEEETKTDTPVSVSQITDGDIMNAYKEFYDDSMTATVASMSQKHLIGLVSLLTLIAKKGGEIFTKKDLLTTYNNICGRLFLSKTDLTGLGEILSLYEASDIIAVKQKEKDKDKENEAPAKKSPVKTPMKNEEYTLLVAPDRIKLTLLQDGLFSKYFEE